MMQGKKEMKKMAGAPLMITDLDDVTSTLAYQGTGYMFGISELDYDQYGNYYPDQYGGDFFEDTDENDMVLQAVRIVITEYDAGTHTYIPIRSILSIIYDVGQTLDIYLPYFDGTEVVLYPSITGETYYDEILTQDACTFDNGCASAIICNTAADGIINGCNGCVDDPACAVAVNAWKGSQSYIADSEFPTFVNTWKSQE